MPESERIHYGGDYNAEQWPESVWIDDVRRMQEANVDLVSVGVFSWSRVQEAEGRFDFGWLDRLLDRLGEGGIGVNLATATASPPHWLTRSYPTVLPVTEDGLTLYPGSRQHYAPTAPEYRRLASELVTRIANRYAKHPAVRMWHVNNEYACHLHADYSDNAAVAFRRWLRAKYTTLDGLNEAWGTDFWSQRVTDFEEVLPPRRAPYSRNPSGLLDFRRFTSDSFLELYRTERAIIRASGAQQPVTTNFMGPFFPLDYWKWSEEVDVVADDSYPDPADPESFRESALARDLMRSMKPDRPWILMEQSSNAVNWRDANAWKAPGQMAALSEQAIARGAGSVMFFQWRQSQSGSEKFHSAMLPHAGTDTRTWLEVTELGDQLSRRTAAAPARAQVGIIFDWDNWWALEQPDHPAQVDYRALVQRWYNALHRQHVQVEFARGAGDLSGFKMVIVPALYLMTREVAERLRDFVHAGGVLVTTPFTDIVDEHDRFRDGGFGMQLAEVWGARPIDFAGIPRGLAESVGSGDLSFGGETLKEELVLSDSAVVLASTADGRPAVVEHQYGRGLSIHLALFPDEGGVRAIVRLAADRAGITPVVADLPEFVEAVELVDGSVVLINQRAAGVDGSSTSHPSLGAFEIRRLEKTAAAPAI